MKRVLWSAAAMAVAVILAGCAQTQVSGAADRGYSFGGLDRVAVVKVGGRLGGEAARNQLADLINQELLKRGYSPVERQQARTVMEERDFQVSSATEAARLGRLLNVDAALIANVPSYREELSMSMKLVNVADAAIIWTSSGTASTGGDISQLAGGLTGAVAGAVVGEEATDSDAGAIAGGAGGAAAGAAIGDELSPQKTEQAGKLIDKLFKSLPANGTG